MSREFDNNLIDLVKQKRFYPGENMNGFKNFKEKLLNKENLHSSLIGKLISDNEYEHVVECLE